ncbi:MAG: ATP-binding protein, partial [Candidatus Hydrogenedentota bacterium]
QVYGTAMDGAGGTRLSTLFVMRDVTHLNRLETIRQDFVANVSHELRTPVTAIRGYVETLLDGAYTEPEEAKRFLEIIEKHSRNLEAIIEDLLSLSRLEAGEEQRQIALAPARIRPVVEGAVQSCDAAAREKSIDVTWTCEGDLTANINPPLLQQALTNLIQNAIAYSEAGRPVSIAADDDYGMRIAVQDNGPGIEARHLGRIFERFYRVDKARSRRHGGTGLGLAIVKHIMTLHRGVVTVDSTPGKGSTFTLSIPSPVAVAD